jgi:hypothetical protein
MQHFRPALQAQLHVPAEVALHARDLRGIHDGRAVDLPERFGVQLGGELPDGLADQRFAARP